MMMLLQRSRATASRVLSRLSRSNDITSVRLLSSSDEGPAPLFLWLGDSSSISTSTSTSTEQTATRPPNKLLLPVTAATEPTVLSSDDVLASVNLHYESDQHFVGGMGESDPGVSFCTVSTCSTDALDFAQLVAESIALVKQERHGVPFSLYTSGILSHDLTVPLSELGLESLQVSLFAGSPRDYQKATGRDAAAFGQVCGFIADATEQGVAVEVGVLSTYASGARDLALSLGARQVHVYPAK